MGTMIFRPDEGLVIPGVRVWQQGDSGAVTPWYLAGGISAANCKAAYAPKGAASLTDSYINLANPGTNNAAPGVAPGWNATDGWIGDGSTKYLTTGVIPVNDQTWSVLVRITGSTSSIAYPFGSRVAAGARLAINAGGGSGSSVTYYNGSNINIAGAPGSAVLGVVGNKAYRNGVAETGTISTASGTLIEFYVIGMNFDGALQFPFDGKIQALAIYNATLTAPQVAAVATSMNLI